MAPPVGRLGGATARSVAAGARRRRHTIRQRTLRAELLDPRADITDFDERILNPNPQLPYNSYRTMTCLARPITFGVKTVHV